MAQSTDVDEMGYDTTQFDYGLENAHAVMVYELEIVEESVWLWNLRRWDRLLFIFIINIVI